MHHQHVAGGKVGEQIFRAPAQAGNGLAGQALDEILGQRPAQIGAARLHLGEACSLHRRLRVRGVRFRLREVRALAN